MGSTTASRPFVSPEDIPPTTEGAPDVTDAQVTALVRKLELYSSEDIQKEPCLFAQQATYSDDDGVVLGRALAKLGPTKTNHIFLPEGPNSGDLGDGTASAIGAALEGGACPDLLSLIMNNTQLTDTGFKALVAGVSACPSLRDLFVTKSRLGDDGFGALVGCMRQGALCRLEMLDLSGEPWRKCGVSDGSFLPFATALADGEIKLLDLTELRMQESTPTAGGRVVAMRDRHVRPVTADRRA